MHGSQQARWMQRFKLALINLIFIFSCIRVVILGRKQGPCKSILLTEVKPSWVIRW